MLLDTLRTPMGKTARPSVGGQTSIEDPAGTPRAHDGLRAPPGLRQYQYRGETTSRNLA